MSVVVTLVRPDQAGESIGLQVVAPEMHAAPMASARRRRARAVGP